LIEISSIENAKRLQNELAKRVVLEDALPNTIEKIAGVDISNNPYDPSKMLFGSIVVLYYPSLEAIEIKTQKSPDTYTYIHCII
jgi:deoxyinosine 3'endonuclease (endonuclease V)